MVASTRTNLAAPTTRGPIEAMAPVSAETSRMPAGKAPATLPSGHAASQRTGGSSGALSANPVDAAGQPRMIANPHYDPMPIPDPLVTPWPKGRSNAKMIPNPRYTGK